MADKKNPYMSPPKPIKLEAPETPESFEPPPRRERGILPEIDAKPIGMPGRKPQARDDGENGLGVFRAAQRSYGSRHEPYERRMPPPPPPLRPGEMPRRRRAGEPIRGVKKPRYEEREPSLLQKITRFRINPVILSVTSWLIVGVVIIVAAVMFVSGLFIDNAFSVYLNDEWIGYIPISDDMTSEEFHELALISLQSQRGGAQVIVEERVTIEPTRAPANDIQPSNDIISIITRKFTYMIAAIEIYVNGNFEALMRTEYELQHVEWLLQERWYNENTVSAEFINGWSTEINYVDPNETEFDTPEDAYYRLDRPTRRNYQYTIQRGDNLGSIAVRFGTSVNEIMSINNLTSSNIYPGDQLTISTMLPLLSVRTFDEIPTTEIIEFEVDTRHREDMPQSFQNIIQQGQRGQQVTVLRIIREDGMEMSRETLEAEITIEPITHIIEVGTGPPATERR